MTYTAFSCKERPKERKKPELKWLDLIISMGETRKTQHTSNRQKGGHETTYKTCIGHKDSYQLGDYMKGKLKLQ
ncbi:hypothetical protein VNO77_43543 [Canavalia gladiata]|uniref:Uncharacterized protein n=1 Tax=Canavalia gladiata TaxID=3824 RepID=A0AAN9JWF2_CANGL